MRSNCELVAETSSSITRIAGTRSRNSILPIDAVEPTPFQRDLSDAHHKRLADVINKTGRFLDPIIVVTAPRDGFWTPNGRHRLEAMRRLGANRLPLSWLQIAKWRGRSSPLIPRKRTT
jgi:hypothetical protein